MVAEPAPTSPSHALLRRANRRLIRLLGDVGSAAVDSPLPLYRLMAVAGQARRVGTAHVRGVRLRLLVDDYCDYAVLKTWATAEPATLDWIDGFPPGSALLDVGANVGRFALYAAARHPSLRVAAVDPDARVSHRFARSIALNGLQARITNVLAAASDRDGFERMTFDARVEQGRVGVGAPDAGAFGYTVATMRIDSMVARGLVEQPSHVKIDVDGHELRVLAGARETLRSPVMRSILVEVDAASKSAVTATLAEAGFAPRSAAVLETGFENVVFEKRPAG